MRAKGRLRSWFFPVLFSVIPGWGHFWIRRFGRGMLLFVMFFMSLNYSLMEALGRDSFELDVARPAGALAAGVLAFSIADILRLAFWGHTQSARNKRQLRIRKAIIHYLRSEYGQAEESLRRVLRVDHMDRTALFYLGLVQAESGKRKKARRSLAQALAADRGREWDTEIRRELGAL